MPRKMFCIVMEKCVGTLLDLVPQGRGLQNGEPYWRKLKLYEVSRMMKQLLGGLAYLHENDIIHG